MVIDPTNPSIVYVSAGGQLFETVNGGVAWTARGSCISGSIFALAIDPQSPMTLYAGIVGGVGGVCKSPDGGTTWIPMNAGLPGASPGNAFQTVAVDPQNPSTLYAGSGDGRVFKSVNGASSWTPSVVGGTGVVALAVDPQTTATVYAGTTTGGVFKSTDGGTSWTPMNTGLGSSFIFDLAVDPQTSSTVYAGTISGLFKSVNGGGSWVAIDSGLTDTFIQSLVVDPHAPATLYVSTQSAGVFTSADGGANWAPMNNGLSQLRTGSLVISPSGTFLHVTVPGGPVFDFQIAPGACGPGGSPGMTSLVAAILPSSRSVQVGTTATAFATIINAGGTAACGTGIALASAIPATFKYNTTDCATNAVTGADNAPVDIAPGAPACYVVSITPTGPFAPTEVAFTFAGSNTLPVATLVAINTLLMSASTTPVPDIVALAATVTNDGIVHLPGPMGAGAFAVATSNLGITAAITVATNTGGAILPLIIALCQTDPITGACISLIGPSVATVIGAGATPTFGIFVTASGAIPLDPANSRIFVTFTDGAGVIRGRTSVAVTTE
jgi:photosystem II stability/assembly factor-like uncharacterized protein